MECVSEASSVRGTFELKLVSRRTVAPSFACQLPTAFHPLLPPTHPPSAAELTRTMDEMDAGMSVWDKAAALQDAFPPAYWQALAVVMALYLVGGWTGPGCI